MRLLITTILCFTLMQCNSAKQVENATVKKEIMLETNPSITVNQPYFQKWVAGIEAGGSGINIYFPNLINKENYTLKQVYFRGMVANILSGKASYFANLKQKQNDIIMSNEPQAEFGNTLPNNAESFPFNLKQDQCVISYHDNGETKYVKIYGIVEKQGAFYPSAPPKMNKE